MAWSQLLQIGLALGLGLLIGLQRERTEGGVAGIRTFPLIALLGVLTGLAAGALGGWLVAAAFLALAGLLIVGTLGSWRGGRVDPGITTEVAALVTLGIGVALSLGYTVMAVVVAGATVILLQWKHPLHRFVEQLGRDDLRALTHLVLIALVVLPLLPDRSFGPYDVLNPFRIWLMVVLIVGLSMAAYVAYKLLGPRGGPLAAGAFGGLISSTAATVSFARSGEGEDGWAASGAALAIVVASAISFLRVLFEIAVVAPSTLYRMAPPLGLMMLVLALASAALFPLVGRGRGVATEERGPPSSIPTALVFGLLYAVVLVAVAFASDRFGRSGMFVVAGLSGLTDMDAITLSTAQLVRTGEVAVDTGWRLVLIGGLANLVFKGIAVAVIARGRIRTLVGAAFGVSILFGAVLLWLWP